MGNSALPTEEQRRGLCELMHNAFIELIYLPEQRAHDLAHAFHNLPMEMCGSWNVATMKARLERYQQRYEAEPGYDYLGRFNQIFRDA